MNPLQGIKVLEVALYLPAPFAGLILSDLGAEVIKIEPPPDGDPLRKLGGNFSKDGGKAFSSFNRGKKSCILNLKSVDARNVFYKMVSKADILLVSMRPSTIKRLGIDYESVRKVNEKIIYCSITGYGLEGPWAEKAGHDLNYESASAVLHLSRDSEGKVVLPPIPAADIFGSYHAVVSILSSLIGRNTAGKGEFIDIAMIESILSANLFNMALSDIPGESYEARGKMLTGRYAFYNVYETQDGKWLALAAIEESFWEKFCEKIGRKDFIGKQFDPALTEELRKIFKEKDYGYWVELFKEEDVCLEPVCNIDDAINNPQLLFRKTFAINSTNILAFGFFPFKPVPEKLKVPAPGEHTQSVLKEFAISPEMMKKVLD